MVCFSLGSNMGDKAAYLKQALTMLSENIGEIISVSSVYETEPWGVNLHENYLNTVACYRTILSPDEVFNFISSVEKKLGRIRTLKSAEPRTIDIDILFFDDLIIKNENLTIPHPLIKYRKFVLQPLSENMEKFIHPEYGLTIKELLAQCTDTSAVIKTDLRLFLYDV